MAKVKPLVKRKQIKKKTTKFIRWQSDNFMRVPESWRKPRGIDGKHRRRFKGAPKHAKCGYGSNKYTKHVLPNGFKKFLVNNVAELEVLLMHNRTYCAEIAHNVSSTKRRAIVDRAQALNIAVTNATAKLVEEDDE
mmetsp:Transcript_104458/g.225462  ORF Transcript_104458/g.225462 Transcript_104458/m.225462 type:complete len:136 (-) Transcript_104458:60-467(-)|eukprot:CAMPEP_0116954834 /NCGR_PEP_ID=MMETSP0467-20121206/42217_1 /TAXON_ID=283647 /ORGANISM="Mesodinium pulex, Strain SPMC105" /LENGTH=135 /DNA_ID=CAMNT_0004640679 /DNA_START=41 /DNA_END=448 /DNA_ORIENTATION=+